MKKNESSEQSESTSTAAVANRFGVPVWTGKDVENFRRQFASKGKEKMSFDDLAELLGLKHRSQAKRLEDQQQVSPSMSIALEYVKRLLTEERGGYLVDWKLEEETENKYRARVERQDKKIKLTATTGDQTEDGNPIVNISFIKPINLQINEAENEQNPILHRLCFD